VHRVADCVADISASLLRELALSINWMARFSLFALRNEAAALSQSKRGPKNSKLYNANHLMNERPLRQRACALLAIERKVLARRVLKLRG
jgi:hypothetical protein